MALSIGCHSDCTYTSEIFPYTTVCFRKGALGKKCFPALQPPTTAERAPPNTVDPATTKDDVAPFTASSPHTSPSTNAPPSTDTSLLTLPDTSSSTDASPSTSPSDGFPPSADADTSTDDAQSILTIGKEAKLVLEEVNAKLKILLNSTTSGRAASDISRSCSKMIAKIDELKIASDNEDIVKVLNVAKALAITLSSVVCNKTEKDILTTKQHEISKVSNQVDSLISQAQQFLEINLSNDEKLIQSENTKEAVKVVKNRTEVTIAVVQKEQTKLESFSGALDSLRSWFFCFVGGQDYCNSKNTTLVTTSISPTESIEMKTTTPTTIKNLTELKTVTDSAAKIKSNAEATIFQAQAKTVTLKTLKATLFQLQSLLFLGSGNIPESRSLTVLTLATQFAPSGAVTFENGDQPKQEKHASLFRSGKACDDSCDSLITCFHDIETLINSDKEEEALVMAKDLKPDISALSCTQDQKKSISQHISKATETASKIGKTLSSVVKESVSELISALGSVLAANEDLIKLSK